MKNIIILILITVCTVMSLQAQVQFNLSLLPDQETYLVSLVPEKNIESPLNMTSNIQVVLKVPAGNPFLAGELTSQIEGVDWIDNAYLSQAAQGESYGLCAFVMAQSSTKSITFEEGVEIPLFTFKNLENGCVGAIALPENTDNAIQKAVAGGFNFTQNITLLSTRGNAYSGVANKIADCAAFSTSIAETDIVEGIKAYPVPTNKKLTLEWTNSESYETLQLRLVNVQGQLLQEIALDASKGAKNAIINVENYPSGLYNFQLMNEKGNAKQYKFIVMD